MKKLLVLNYEFPPLGGGASPVSYDIALGLSKANEFDIDVVTMGFRGLPSHEKVNPNLNIYRVRCLRSKKEICHPWEQATYLYAAYNKCRLLMQNKHYDLCHAHFLIPTGILAILLKKKFGLKYVITAHGSDVPGYNNDRFVFAHRFTKPLLKKVAKEASEVVTGSYFLRDLINDSIGSSSEPTVIRQGIDIPTKFRKNKKRIILATGRLLRRKGFQYLIESVSSHDLKYELHICGDGPMKRELELLANKSKTRVIFHGWLEKDSEIYKNLLAQAAIFCLPSEKENASVSLLEAMASGCAIITSNTSGCGEIAQNIGILVNPTKSDEIGKKLQEIISNEEKLRLYQRKSRGHTEKYFTLTQTISNYSRLLNSVHQNESTAHN